MRQRKIYQLLLLFHAQDLDGFQAYLSNPYFNNSKTIIEFYARFRKMVVEREEECTLEEFMAGTKLTRRRMDKLCSQLYALGCDFLALQAFQKNAYTRDEMLLEAIEDRESASREAVRLYQRMQTQLGDRKDSPDTILRGLRLRWRHAAIATKGRETRQLWQENFHGLHELLDEYYQLQKLKLLSATANIKNIFNQDERDPGIAFLEAMQVSNDDARLSPLARAYYLTIQMMQAEDGEAWFEELLPLLGDTAPQFDPAEAMELYGYALNFCIRNSNKGRLEYLSHASSLYIQLLDSKLILQNGELWPQQFKNIVALHCRLERLDWVRTFIDEFAAYLPKDSRKGDLMYNEAVFSFYKGAYAPAIEQFKQVIAELTDDVFYGIDARVYLWKSYFECYADLTMEEVDDMHKLYDSFRVFIERNEKIAAAHKKHYRNFIREFKRLMEVLRIKPTSQKSLEQLRSDILSKGHVANKGWLLQKINRILEEIAN